MAAGVPKNRTEETPPALTDSHASAQKQKAAFADCLSKIHGSKNDGLAAAGHHGAIFGVPFPLRRAIPRQATITHGGRRHALTTLMIAIVRSTRDKHLRCQGDKDELEKETGGHNAHSTLVLDLLIQIFEDDTITWSNLHPISQGIRQDISHSAVTLNGYNTQLTHRLGATHH